MKKRVLAALLALVMLFGALPMSVFAEDLETVEEPSGTFEPDEPEKYTYHLYYDFNYVGTGSTKRNIEYGPTADTSYTYTVDSQTLTCREGYNFLGWADGKNATEPDYRGGDTITLTWQNPTKTIYAVWEKQPQPDITDPTEFIGIKTVPVQCDNKAGHYMEYAIDGLIEKKCAELVWSTGSKEATLKLYPEKIAKRFSALKGTHTAVSTSVVTVTLAYNGGWKIDGAIPVIYVTCAAPEIPDPTEFIGIKTVPVQCNNKADHYMQYAIDGLIEKKCAELVWSTGSKEATLKLYPEKIANRFSALKGTHTAVTTDVVTVKLTYSGGWKIDGAIPVIHVTCAAPEIPDPKTDVRELNIYVKCVTPGVSHSTLDVDLGSLESSSGWTVAWTKPNTTATLTLYPDKIAEHYSKTLPGHTAVSTTAITIGLTYANGKWAADRVLPDIEVKCEPAIPNPTDYVKEQFVTVVCDNKTAHQNIQYQLENLPAGSVDVQWDGTAKTAKLVLKPEKIAEHYGKSFGAHTAVNPADIKVELTYANDAWSLSAAIPDVHVTCKPAQEIPNPKDSFNKLLVNVACNTENSGHDPIEVPLSAVANSVNVRWEPGTATAYITLTPSIFATYYSQHNNGANGAHDPVAPAAVTVEAHYDNEKGWFWTKPTINVKCEPVYTITYNWRGVVKPMDVKNVNNPGTFTADELPITLKAPDFKNNEWPQKFLNWRDAAGNVVTQITEPGNVELYAYYQFPVKYTVYDENDQKVDELSVTEWYNEDDFADYSLRSGEKTGHDFDGWYQTTKDFGNTNKRVTELYKAKKWELVGKLTRKEYTVVAKMYLDGAPHFRQNTDFYTYQVTGLYGDPINFESIKAQAIAQAEKDRPASASYDASVIEDWAGNATCTTFGEHQPDLDTPHYVNVHVNTTQHVYVYRMIDGKMEATEYHHSTAPFGANVVEHLNANVQNLDMPGYSHDEWFKKDVPALDVKFGDTDTIKGWTNVVIKYTKNEFPVTYDYACTDPALMPNWKVWETLPENPYTYAPGESVRVAMMPDDVEDGEYIWKFVTWKLNGVDVVPNAQVPMVEGGLTFVGIWERTQKEYGVTYDYACTDPALVPNWKVWATLPENKNTYTVGQKVTTAAKPDDVDDGEYIWKFITWKLGDTEVAPNTQVEMVAGGLTFVGIWEHTQKEYGVTYDYACTDPALVPNWKVWATLPENKNTYTVGQKVTTAAKPDDVDDGEYIWKFITWKLGDTEVAPNTQVEMVAGGLTFVGIWEHTQKEYGVTYSYDPSLPDEVQATLPKNPDTYTVGQKVTTAAKPNSVRVGEYIWTFKTWKLDGVEVAPNTQVDMVSGGLHFEGIWQKELIHYSLTIQYVDKKGKELAESHKDLLAKGEAYKVDSPKIKGYKLKDKDDAVIEGTMPGRNLTIEVVYIKKSTGGGSGTIDSPNKPTTKAPALTLNTDDHFAFINGYPDGSVQPEGNVTRAETAAILYRIMGDACQSYYKTNSSSYSDVARGDWYNTYVATLENAGVIVDTRTNGKFRPNDAITRAELASMIAQFAGLESASAAKFNDVGSRYWAAEEIAIAAKMGWINGYPDGSFRPDRNVTRAELMAMVNRALGRTPKSAGDLLSGMKTWRDNANVNAWYYLDVQEATNDHTYTKSGTHETWKKLL